MQLQKSSAFKIHFPEKSLGVLVAITGSLEHIFSTHVGLEDILEAFPVFSGHDDVDIVVPRYESLMPDSPQHAAAEKRIADVAVAANKAIGILNGPSHTEIKVTAEGPKIVELGARLGGDCITTHLVPLSTGVDMVECSIRIALGEKPVLENSQYRGSAIRYLQSDVGTIENISGLEEARSIHGVKQVSIVHGKGEYAGKIKSSTDRIGFVIAQAEDVTAAIQIAENSVRKIKITVNSAEERATQ